MKPIIAILCSKTEAGTAPAVSKVNLAYIRAVEKNGGIPLLIPYSSDGENLARLMELAQGLLLPGGVDVEPSRYGEQPHPALGSVDTVLDGMDLAALRQAEERDIPVLAICRGIQSMNVYAGGTLWQDIPSQIEYAENHARGDERNRTVHRVILEEGSSLQKCIGERVLAVNSCHHQAVKELGSGFAVTARSEDGIIEGMEGKDGRWVGVQWHPEELVDMVPDMNRIFAQFIRLAAEPKKELKENEPVGEKKKRKVVLSFSGKQENR